MSFSGFEDEEEYVDLRNPNDNYMYSFSINSKDNKIYGIAAADSTELPVGDIRVDGIGTGSTFNEVYEKFGKPCSISTYSLGYNVIEVDYSFESDEESYVVIFRSTPVCNKTKNEERIKPNVITSIGILVLK